MYKFSIYINFKETLPLNYYDMLFFLGLLPCSVLFSFFDRSTEYKNLILIITSVLFFSWAKPMTSCLLFLTVLFDYLIGLCIEKSRDENRSASKALLATDFAMNAAVFFIFAHNYLFDAVENLSFSDAVIPVGVAYYTVRGFSYCYDIFKGSKAEKNIFCLLTYMVSYHFMIVGPVVRYKDIEPQIRKRTVTGREINMGLNRFIIGLGKAVLLANVFNQIKLAGLNGHEITLLGCWVGMTAFFAEGYFMFTGLSDMAMGLGLMNGFTYPKNYRDMGINGLFLGLVKSYNTTLTEFFGEVFSSLGKRKKLLSAVSIIACCVALAIWYEAKLNYILVGLAVGIVLVGEKYFWGSRISQAKGIFKAVYVFGLAFFLFGGLYFSSFYGYRKWLLGLVNVGTDYKLSVALKYTVLGNIFLIAIAFAYVCVPIRNKITALTVSYSERSPRAYGQTAICKTVLRAVILVTCIATLAVQYTA